MYHGKFERKKAPARYEAKRCAKRTSKRMTLVLSLVLILTFCLGGTLAFLLAETLPITNTFTPAQVSCEVTENFDGTSKTEVNVKNTSDIEAYIRVKLVTYRVNDSEQHIGGTAEIPSFNLGEGWFEKDGYYYYSKPVAAGKSPETNLISSIILAGSYSDADGGKQVIEVLAEAIQSVPTNVVEGSWKVTVSADGTLTQGGNAQ